MKEVLTIRVAITDCLEVKGKSECARMLLFDGTCDCEYFKGMVLPGGVDTQKDFAGKETMLSARYILEGQDSEGRNCRIFIENNGQVDKNGQISAIPHIITDSNALSFLENAELKSTVEGIEGGVLVHIFLMS